MILGRRKPKMPPGITTHLDRDDEPLAATELVDGSWAVVASGALVVVGHGGVQERHPWHEVEHGSWDGDAREFTVTWVDGAVPPLVLGTAEDEVSRFTAVLRERVQSSVVHTESMDLPGGAFVRVNIRRDEAGQLFSQLTAQGELRDDEAEHQLIDDLERRARAAVGLAT